MLLEIRGATGNIGGNCHPCPESCPQMPLTDLKSRNAKPTTKTERLFDGQGRTLFGEPRQRRNHHLLPHSPTAQSPSPPALANCHP